jgi:hypothetical protein
VEGTEEKAGECEVMEPLTWFFCGMTLGFALCVAMIDLKNKK